MASSKSAMNTLAPQFRALMIILRSTGAGDLDAAVQQVCGDRRDAPVGGADVRGLGQEVGQVAGVEAGLTRLAGFQQLAATGVEAAMQVGHEGQRVMAQDLVEARAHGAHDDDAFGGVLVSDMAVSFALGGDEGEAQYREIAFSCSCRNVMTLPKWNK